MNPRAAEGAEIIEPKDADRWPSPLYWLICGAVGAGLSYLVNGNADWGSHMGSHGAVAMLFLSMLVSAAAAVSGCILAMFQKTRLAGIASLAAGLGGSIVVGIVFFAH